MNKQWISQLANEIENRYGKETRNKIFGNIENMENDQTSISEWFDNFITGMDELDDKEYLQQMMVKHCPCGKDNDDDVKKMKEIYESSSTLEEFVEAFDKWVYNKYDGDVDVMELRGNVLYMIKPLGGHETTGSCGKGCHCFLAKETNKVISDIFCYCCTIGHTGKDFKTAFGENIKMEFIESIICGGKRCIMAIHLPEKSK